MIRVLRQNDIKMLIELFKISGRVNKEEVKNIYYNMNVVDAITNQDVVAEEFEIFKNAVFSRIQALTDAGFIIEKVADPNTSVEEEDEE